MQLTEYVRTTGGRIGFASASIGLLGAALSILMSSPGQSMLALTTGLSLSITGFIAALVIGIRESQKFVLIAVCFLPPAGGVFFALVLKWRSNGTDVAAYAILAAAVAAAIVAAVSKKSA